MNKFNIFLMLFFSIIGFCEYPKSILFIGNSYLYYNDSMHNHVEELMEDYYKDQEIVTKSATIGGSRLENHNIDHLLKPQNLQRKKQVDMLIMQGGSGEVIDEVSRKRFIKTAVKYSKKARKKGIIPALFMTHAYTKNDDRYEANLIEKIKMTYFEAGRQSKALVIPVGIAYESAYLSRPDIKLHHPDGTHPGMLGTYLGACVIFAFITSQSPVGLDYNYLNRISDKDKLFLQEIAWQTYLEFN
jgi:hypothetical protein